MGDDANAGDDMEKARNALAACRDALAKVHTEMESGTLRNLSSGQIVLADAHRIQLDRVNKKYDIAWAEYLEAVRTREARQAAELTASNVKIAETQLALLSQSTELAKRNTDIADSQLTVGKDNVALAKQSAEINKSIRRLTVVLAIASVAQVLVAIATIAHGCGR
jgi:hypothetical protein